MNEEIGRKKYESDRNYNNKFMLQKNYHAVVHEK